MDMLLTLDDLASYSDDELYALHDEMFFRLVRCDLGAFARSLAIACLDNIKIVLHSRATMRYRYGPVAAR